ncbi:MAG: DUF1722 domain-containing protein [Clostridia bacterium]
MTSLTTSDLFSSEKRSFCTEKQADATRDGLGDPNEKPAKAAFDTLTRAWCEQVWAEHKYWVMLKSYRLYKDIAQLFKAQHEREKTNGNRSWAILTEELSAFLTQVQSLPIDEKNAVNALQHAFGHISDALTEAERKEWLALASIDWKQAYDKLFVLAMEHGNDYLQRSRLFSPDVPLTNVWVRCKGTSWFIRHNESGWDVLSPEEVLAELEEGGHRVEQLAAFRLAAKLGPLVQPLEQYQQVIQDREPLESNGMI